jgi:type II secretory pathway component GspD/PulD (secretin)
MRRRVPSLITCVLVVIVSAGVLAANGLAKLEQDASFHIAAGSLESALIEFSRETGVQVVVSASVANILVRAVEGRRNPRDVLTTLLNDTGLTFTIVGQTITVYASDSTKQPRAVSPPEDSVKITAPAERKP